MTEIRVADQAERHAALDVTRSFIVQAPAGSGKTALLVSRYLKLLEAVEKPEEIVAIEEKSSADRRKIEHETRSNARIAGGDWSRYQALAA